MVGENEAVLVVEDGIAKARVVTGYETVEEFRRIEGKGISDGTQVIVGGVHYVSDGQPVTVTGSL